MNVASAALCLRRTALLLLLFSGADMLYPNRSMRRRAPVFLLNAPVGTP
jgi:hypothetical protein